VQALAIPLLITIALTFLVFLSCSLVTITGAAGQAVQNMNIMMGFDEKEGLQFNGIFS